MPRGRPAGAVRPEDVGRYRAMGAPVALALRPPATAQEDDAAATAMAPPPVPVHADRERHIPQLRVDTEREPALSAAPAAPEPTHDAEALTAIPPSPAEPPVQSVPPGPPDSVADRVAEATGTAVPPLPAPPPHRPPPTGPPQQRGRKRAASALGTTAGAARAKAPKCEDCGRRVRRWAMPTDTEKRWCTKCVEDDRHPGAVKVATVSTNGVPTRSTMCEDCKEKFAHYGELGQPKKKRRWCLGCVNANGHTAVLLTRNKMCEDCNQKQANFGTAADMKKRWCSGCVKRNGHTAVNVCGHKKCEGCNAKFASYGMLPEGKRRWCGVCVKREPALTALGSASVVYINGDMCRDCGLHCPTYGEPNTRKRVWCAGCAKANHPSAVEVTRSHRKPPTTKTEKGAPRVAKPINYAAHKKCQQCKTKHASYGCPIERKRRWCGGCAKREQGSNPHPPVNLNLRICEDCKTKPAKYGDGSSSDSAKQKDKRWCEKCAEDHPEAIEAMNGGSERGAIVENLSRISKRARHSQSSPAAAGGRGSRGKDREDVDVLPMLAASDLPNDDDDNTEGDDGSSGGSENDDEEESMSVRLSKTAAALAEHHRLLPLARAPPDSPMLVPSPLSSRLSAHAGKLLTSLGQEDDEDIDMERGEGMDGHPLSRSDGFTTSHGSGSGSDAQHPSEFPTPTHISPARPGQAGRRREAAERQRQQQQLPEMLPPAPRSSRTPKATAIPLLLDCPETLPSQGGADAPPSVEPPVPESPSPSSAAAVAAAAAAVVEASSSASSVAPSQL
jgi:hypothetical protein